YLLPVADIDENGNITDWRKQGSLAEQNAQTLYLRKDDNLAALRDKEASRKNLGLGQLAVMDTDTARQTLRITQLENELVGIPLPYPGATAPDGWLKCNGQSFNKSMYPLLAGRYLSGFL
ncbi:phage tail protein, partial [Pectobacterium versatile]|nr:phage tail protein [Pectobacterium versatile]